MLLEEAGPQLPPGVQLILYLYREDQQVLSNSLTSSFPSPLTQPDLVHSLAVCPQCLSLPAPLTAHREGRHACSQCSAKSL